MERNWPLIGAILALALVVLSVISWLYMPFLPFIEERQAGEETIEQTYDAEKAIQDYRWFRAQYEEIKAQHRQIDNARDAEAQFHETYGNDPSQWGRQAETRHGRLHQRIEGYQDNLENLVAEYNARSSDATRAVFKCHLPYQVDERMRIRGPPGSSDAEQPWTNETRSPPPAQQCDGLPEKAT